MSSVPPKARFGVATTAFSPTKGWRQSTPEIARLITAAERRGVEPVPIVLGDILFAFPLAGRSDAFLSGKSLRGLDGLIVRRTGENLNEARLLCEMIVDSGGSLVDPLDRFLLGGVTKLVSTADRHERSVGSSSIVAAEHDQLATVEPLCQQWIDEYGALVVKPVAGAQGRGVTIVKSLQQLPEALEKLDGASALIQAREAIHAEYRVLMLNGRPLGVARKDSSGEGPANAAQGAEFVSVPDQQQEEVLEFVGGAAIPDGLVGADVALTERGYVIIEENYSPQWVALEKATGVDVAGEIIDDTLGRSS